MDKFKVYAVDLL